MYWRCAAAVCIYMFLIIIDKAVVSVTVEEKCFHVTALKRARSTCLTVFFTRVDVKLIRELVIWRGLRVVVCWITGWGFFLDGISR